jgi:hypothetical protein
MDMLVSFDINSSLIIFSCQSFNTAANTLSFLHIKNWYFFMEKATSNDWHVHNPYLGEVNPSSSDLLGYALDGFPIYGPVSDVSVLDGCNGRTVNGQYQYHVRVRVSLLIRIDIWDFLYIVSDKLNC